MEKFFLTPKDVMKITGIAYSTACRTIQTLNRELNEKGIKTYRGKISKKYYFDKYGISDNNVSQ